MTPPHIDDFLARMEPDDHNLCYVPAMVGGEIVEARPVDFDKVMAAFREAEGSAPPGSPVERALLPEAQVLREPLVDRAEGCFTDDYLYQVLPHPPLEAIALSFHTPIGPELYDLPARDGFDFIQAAGARLAPVSPLFELGLRLSGMSAEVPEELLRMAWISMSALMASEMISQMVDAELGYLGRPGSMFLDGWVDAEAEVHPGLSALLAARLPGAPPMPIEPSSISIRALPTRQVHITAGNSPLVPILSSLRALATRSRSLIKSPYGATLPGALLALAMLSVDPDHPLVRNTSIVYWKGGDRDVEDRLLTPALFDRIVVWGSPAAVESMSARPIPVRQVYFNPRYGVSLIGAGALGDGVGETAARAAQDVMIWNQKACIASMVHYVEGDEEEVRRYCRALRESLAAWDSSFPQVVPAQALGRRTMLRRGRLIGADWYPNGPVRGAGSCVVYSPGDFPMAGHPMFRTVVVRRVDRLEDALGYLHPGVSAVGVAPEPRRLDLRDAIAVRGPSSIFPLGHGERFLAGMPHDGMRVLNELVEWKVG